jgi:hypothetical protein
MNWEEFGRKRQWYHLRWAYCPSVSMERAKKTKEKVKEPRNAMAVGVSEGSTLYNYT